MASFSKTFDSNIRRIIKKISYERREYESVDEKSLSYLGYVPKNDGKMNSGSKGLKENENLHLCLTLFLLACLYDIV